MYKLIVTLRVTNKVYARAKDVEVARALQGSLSPDFRVDWLRF